MKRFISCLLVGSLVFSLSVSVFGFKMVELDNEKIFSPELIEKEKQIMEERESKTYNLPNNLKGFRDVPKNHWAYPSIMGMTEKGLFAGVTAPIDGVSTFAPNNPMTKAQFITVVTRYLFEEELKGIKVESGLPWYAANEDIALRYGLIDESWSKPEIMNQPINRQEMAFISNNVLKYLGHTVENMKSKSDIPDFNTVGTVYSESVLTCYSAGILSGVDSKGTFSPLGVVNRAQGATILSRLVNIVETSTDSKNTVVLEDRVKVSSIDLTEIEKKQPFVFRIVNRLECDSVSVNNVVYEAEKGNHYIVFDVLYQSNTKVLTPYDYRYSLSIEDMSLVYNPETMCMDNGVIWFSDNEALQGKTFTGSVAIEVPDTFEIKNDYFISIFETKNSQFINIYGGLFCS